MDSRYESNGGSLASKKMSKLTALSPVPISMDDNTDEFESSVSGIIINDTTRSIENADLRQQQQSHQIGDGSSISWCSSCRIGEPTIISGNNSGKYTIWNVELDTLRGSRIIIRKRYTDFENLRELLKKFYSFKTNIPQLPPKTFLFTNRFDPVVLEDRRKGLEFFLSSVLLNPLLCNSKEVLQFVGRK